MPAPMKQRPVWWSTNRERAISYSKKKNIDKNNRVSWARTCEFPHDTRPEVDALTQWATRMTRYSKSVRYILLEYLGHFPVPVTIACK